MTPALSPRRLANGATAMLRTAATDPASLRYLGAWIRSLAGERTPLDDATPWIVFKARSWLEARLRSDLTAFEWGSGGSTRFFADRVGRVVSDRARSRVARAHPCGAHARAGGALRLPADRARAARRRCAVLRPRSYTRPIATYAGMSFERYVRAIDAFDERSLDVVFVDGRARARASRTRRRGCGPAG